MTDYDDLDSLLNEPIQARPVVQSAVDVPTSDELVGPHSSTEVKFEPTFCDICSECLDTHPDHDVTHSDSMKAVEQEIEEKYTQLKNQEQQEQKVLPGFENTDQPVEYTSVVDQEESVVAEDALHAPKKRKNRATRVIPPATPVAPAYEPHSGLSDDLRVGDSANSADWFEQTLIDYSCGFGPLPGTRPPVVETTSVDQLVTLELVLSLDEALAVLSFLKVNREKRP